MDVSIIVPMLNESAAVEECLRSLLHQDGISQDTEILCVDGGSTDGTREIVIEMSKRDARIKLLENPRKIIPTALNVGLKECRGKYVVRADAHSVFAPDYVRQCIETLNRTGASMVGGYIDTQPRDDTAVGSAIATAMRSRFGTGGAKFRMGGEECEVDTVPYGAFRRELVSSVGVYDARLERSEDNEFSRRIQEAGGTLFISPKIKSRYQSRSTYASIARHAFSNGMWGPFTMRMVQGVMSLRHFVPLFFVSGLLGLVIVALILPSLTWLLLAYILAYLMAASFCAVRAAVDADGRVPLILCAFVVLHVAYGLGSMWAILLLPFGFPHNRFENECRV